MRIAGIMLAIVLALTLIAQVIAQPEQTSARTNGTSRFAAFDIRIDPHGRPLAAYQFELKDESGLATIVGVEGGEHAALVNPPYYDPAALTGGRIIIASFNTGDALPMTTTRVARVHMQISGNQSPHFEIKLQAAGTTDGTSIQADISIAESNQSNNETRN